VQPEGKSVANKVFLVHHSNINYLHKTAVDWVNVVIMTLDEGHYYVTFCCDNLWKSKFLALENSGNFFSYFVATL